MLFRSQSEGFAVLVNLNVTAAMVAIESAVTRCLVVPQALTGVAVQPLVTMTFGDLRTKKLSVKKRSNSPRVLDIIYSGQGTKSEQGRGKGRSGGGGCEVDMRICLRGCGGREIFDACRRVK